MRVECDKEDVVLDNDRGIPVPSVCVTCLRCNHKTTSYGTSEKSVTRCLVLLKEECPNSEDNFYVLASPAGEEEYKNLFSSGAARGKEVELLVRDKPLRPPTRRRDDG